MSVRVMSQIWERQDLDPYERLVLLSLADHADDEGRCYPSVARLCARTSMKERGVQNVLRRLTGRGLLSIDANAGKRGTNLYTVNATPAPDAPRIQCTPAPDAPPPRTRCTSTPAPGAPEPSVTVNEPSDNMAKASVAAVLGAWASPEAVASFIGYRKRHKAKALTLTAAKRLAANLKAIFQAGHDPDDALAMAEERGWATCEPEWYLKTKVQANDNRNHSGVPRGRPNRPDPALEQIARLAGLGAAPGNGGR